MHLVSETASPIFLDLLRKNSLTDRIPPLLKKQESTMFEGSFKTETVGQGLPFSLCTGASAMIDDHMIQATLSTPTF